MIFFFRTTLGRGTIDLTGHLWHAPTMDSRTVHPTSEATHELSTDIFITMISSHATFGLTAPDTFTSAPKLQVQSVGMFSGGSRLQKAMFLRAACPGVGLLVEVGYVVFQTDHVLRA